MNGHVYYAYVRNHHFHHYANQIISMKLLLSIATIIATVYRKINIYKKYNKIDHILVYVIQALKKCCQLMNTD